MGNSESHYKVELTNEQLRQTEKTDLQLLSLFSEKEFLNESYIRQKYVHDLESNRHQFDTDVEKSAKRKKYIDTLTNLQCALSSILEDSGNFRMKQMRTIEKELNNFSSLGPTSFDSLFEIKLQFYQKVHSALLRREKRMAANPPTIDLTKSAVIFIKSLYGLPNEDPKVLEYVLRRIQELPNLHSMLFVPDQIPIPEEDNNNSIVSIDQMDVENEQYKESLLDYLFKVVFEEFVSFKQEISASLQLLIYIQRDIILNVSIQNPTSVSIQRFLDYTNKIILFTLELFSLNRIELTHDLSVLYLLIMPFLPCLYLLLNRLLVFNTTTIYSLIPNLLNILKIMDKLIANSEDDVNYLNNLQNSIKLKSPIELESSHNYAPNIDEEITINMNGATHMCITFDPRCNTEAGNDFLQLYRFPNKVDPLLPAFSGRSENWPKIPFIFPGDEITFHFHSSPFGSHWGYKCLVTGLVLETNRKSRFYEVAHTFAMIVRKCLVKSIMGHISEEESQMSSIIESPLLRGGIHQQSSKDTKESQFIEDFIYNKEESTANSIIKHIEKKLPPNPTVERLGAKELGDCIRSFIIANIKHYGLLDILLNVSNVSELSSNIEKQLIQIWLESRKLRQYIASERRRILLERDSESNNNNTNDSEQQKEETIDTSSYEYFNDTILEKMRYLLTFNAAVTSPSSILATNEDIFQEKKKNSSTTTTSSNAILRSSLETSVLGWKELFNTWRLLQLNAINQRCKEEFKEATKEGIMSNLIEDKSQNLNVLQLIDNFVKKADLPIIKKLVSNRIQRSIQRSNSISVLNDLMQSLNSTSLKISIISILPNIRRMRDSQLKGHILCNLFSTGPYYESQVLKQFFALYNNLVHLCRDPTVHSQFRAIIIDSLCLGYNSYDHEFLLLVFPSLHRIYTSTDQEDSWSLALKKHAKLAFQYLSLQCLNVTLISNSLDPLQKYVLELIVMDIEKTAEILKQKKTVKEIDSKILKSYEFHEGLLFDLMTLLHSLLFHPVIQSHLSTVKLATSLLQIQGNTIYSSRISRLSLRMLRNILTTMDPIMFSDLNIPVSDLVSLSNAYDIVSYLFDSIGKSLYLDNDSINENKDLQDLNKISINFTTGQSIINITSERILLIRKLMSISRWNTITSQHLNNSLKHLPTYLNSISTSSTATTATSSKSEYYSILASLSIIGGFIDTGLRIGGRVSVKSSKENALLVYYDKMSCKAKIILDSNPKKIIDCDPDKIVPIEELPFMVDLYPISLDLIDSFNKITSTPMLENAKRKEEDKEVEKNQKNTKTTVVDESEGIVEIEWSCTICTFINAASLSSCQICGSKKPNVLTASSEMAIESTTNTNIISNSSWFCGACTLENDCTSTICAICATPKPIDKDDTKPSSVMSTESISSIKDFEMKDVQEEEEDEEKEEDLIEENYKDILFYRVRSLLINSLASFLKESQSAIKLVSNSETLTSLVNVSVLPLDSEDTKSLEQYDYKLNRIWELLVQKRFNIKEDSMAINSQSKSLSDILLYSPFKSLGILLPSNLDRASAKQIRFPNSDLVTVHKDSGSDLVSPISDDMPMYALVRSNIVIPNSLPEYYFEIKIENKSASKSEAIPVAIGIYREGFELEGIPGNSNSYAYEGFTGHLCHNVGSMRTSRVVEREYGASFTYGDIIGCGWNIRSQSIYFTKNGQNLGDAFDQVNGRFYPCIWSLDPNALISVNFGQIPFQFDFLSKLPKDYLQSLSNEVVSMKGLSTIEIRRRTLAEELMVMMDIFPKELCILALERCKDDMQIAANWLLENGFRELERMANETISKSLREGKEKQEKEILQAILEEQKALGQFIDTPPPSSISSSSSNITTANTNEDNDEEIDSEDDEDNEDDFNREPARYLEEELDVQVPIQIQNQSANNSSTSSIVEELKIDSIIVGMQLSVINKDSKYYGKTGIVTSIDVNTMNIQLKLFNLDTGCITLEWISIQYLQRPLRIYQDLCRNIKDNNSKLIASLAEIECNLTILKIRNSILNLLSIWSSFPFDDIYYNNPHNLVNLLKLTAAQYLLSNSSTSSTIVKNQPILKEFHNRISTLIQLEDKDDNVNRPVEVLPTSILTKECILHFKNALEITSSTITLESTHPYDNNIDNRFIVTIKGSSKLLIRFDSQCSLHKTDPLTRLSFYRDDQYQDCIATYRGVLNQSNTSQSLIIDNDKVFVRFTSGAGETFWGYKFTVTPIDLRLSDSQALNSLNFELGYWILELLIEFAPKLVKNNYINDLYDSIVQYLRHAKKSAKSRGVHLLLRILYEIQHSSNIQVDLSQILKLKSTLERKYLEESQDNKVIYSSYLQSLMELIITAQITQNTLNTTTSTSTTSMLKIPTEIPISESTKNTLIINNCKLILSNGNSKLCTEELQSIVKSYFDSAFLNISFKDLLATLKITEKSKKIIIEYHYSNSYLTTAIDNSIEFNSGDQITIKSPYHWYNSSVDTIETVKYYIKHGKFPKSFIEKSYFVEKLKKEGSKLITENAESTSPPKSCYYSDIHFSVFTLSMWVKIAEFPTQSTTLLTKYSCIDLSLNEITLILDAEKKIQVHLSSNNKDNVDVLASSEELPLNDWIYLNISLDNKKLALSINGSLVIEKIIKSKFLASPGPIYVLKHNISLNSSQQTGDIKISDARLFYRNLSEKETLALSKPQFQHKETVITQNEISLAISNQDKFTHLVDDTLIEFIYSTICEDSNIDINYLDSSLININENTLAKYPLLRNYSLESIQHRFTLIQLLNFDLIKLLPLIDFSQNGSKWTLANCITKLKGIIFLHTKYQLFQKILASTTSNKSRPHITISRPRALKAKEKGDPEGKHSVFGQLYRQLHFISPVSLRRSGQVWSVNYAGEGGQDAGGLFRDSISHVCSDLQSNYIPLLIKCPNAKGFGDNQDKFIPNPNASTSSLQLSMFSFIGKLMGIAIRGKHVLNLDLPSIVWKQIVSSKIGRNDLESIDTFSYKIWDQIKNIEEQEGITVDNFTDFIDLTFTTNSSDGREIQLIPNGNNIQVTWNNRLKYLELLEQYRLNEFNSQVDAIKSGLASIVPVQLLSLFTWQELELSVCGKRDVNIDLLKLNTRYSGYSKTDPVVDMFWKTVEEFSTKEKELLLRFAWGRSRLPLSSEDFEQKFVIMSSPDSNDDSLPVSHTCFFQIELPNYSNINTLKQKVLYAITECREIDADHAAQNVDWDNEEE